MDKNIERQKTAKIKTYVYPEFNVPESIKNSEDIGVKFAMLRDIMNNYLITHDYEVNGIDRYEDVEKWLIKNHPEEIIGFSYYTTTTGGQHNADFFETICGNNDLGTRKGREKYAKELADKYGVEIGKFDYSDADKILKEKLSHHYAVGFIKDGLVYTVAGGKNEKRAKEWRERQIKDLSLSENSIVFKIFNNDIQRLYSGWDVSKINILEPFPVNELKNVGPNSDDLLLLAKSIQFNQLQEDVKLFWQPDSEPQRQVLENRNRGMKLHEKSKFNLDIFSTDYFVIGEIESGQVHPFRNPSEYLPHGATKPHYDFKTTDLAERKRRELIADGKLSADSIIFHVTDCDLDMKKPFPIDNLIDIGNNAKATVEARRIENAQLVSINKISKIIKKNQKDKIVKSNNFDDVKI